MGGQNRIVPGQNRFIPGAQSGPGRPRWPARSSHRRRDSSSPGSAPAFRAPFPGSWRDRSLPGRWTLPQGSPGVRCGPESSRPASPEIGMSRSFEISWSQDAIFSGASIPSLRTPTSVKRSPDGGSLARLDQRECGEELTRRSICSTCS